MVFIFSEVSVKLRGRGQHTLVGRGCRDGTGVHQGDGSDLSALQLASLSVREVSGGMADAEGVVCRGISRTEAGTAEGRLHDCARLQDRCRRSVFDQLHVNGHGSRIYA